ncbi:outer membrane protein assembly factor BamB family protein [Rubripirellula tenax]|nr:PQQ-binding-like beta-propeller repeat protein [Rubripirellula tenax]
MKYLIFPLFCVVISIAMTQPSSADWTRFRGPNGTGISESDAPTDFGADENMRWKLELPGRGISSPIVVGDKVFVTCYSGYGMGDGQGELKDLKRHLVCVDRIAGKTLWTKTVDAKMPEDEFRPPGVTTHGYASNTPTSDGTYVYAFFGKSGVYAYDMDGNDVWNQSVGAEPSLKGFGSAASPIVLDDCVIVNAADESLSIVWLDKMTGKEKFRATAGGLGECWTTPVVVNDGEITHVVVSVIGEVWGLNNATGKLAWYANGVNSRNAQVSAVPGDDGIVYATGEEAVAVRVGGKDDVSKSNTVWEGRVRPRYATPIVMDGHLYSVSGSVFECLDAKTGERVFQERLPDSPAGGDEEQRAGSRPGGFGGGGGRGGGGGGGDYASPVVAEGKIYITTNAGMVHVVEAKSEYKLITSNDMTFDKSGFGATPAISDGNLFLRSNAYLYCIGSAE